MFDLLATLDTTTANGQDGISARMLKSVAASITPSLTKLFNMSLMTGSIPTQWKKSMVVPIPKNSNTSSPTNYRPISLLPIVSKLLERHVYSVILSHFETHYPLSSVQWGFLEGRSTVTALLHCINEWLKALEDGKEVCAIFPESVRLGASFSTHYTLLDLMNTYYAGSTTIFQIVFNQLLLMALSLLLPKSSPEFLKALSLGLCSFSSTLTTFLVFFIT